MDQPATVKLNIVTINDLWESLPEECRPLGIRERLYKDLCQAYAHIVSYMLRDISHCQEASLHLGLFSGPANPEPHSQFVAHWAISDMAKPHQESYNFHRQNTSQWVFAGGLLFQNGKFSIHS